MMASRTTVRVLSVLAALAIAAPNAPAALIGEWLFDQNLLETSGFKPAGTHDGVAVNSISYSTDTPLDSTGYSLDLTNGTSAVRVLNSNQQVNGSGAGGANGTYQATYDSDIANGPMTISAWVKGTPDQWEAYVSQKGEDGNGYQLRRWSNSDNSTFTLRGTGADDDPQGGINTNDGQWHHVVGVWDAAADTRRLYVDGVEDTTAFRSGDSGSVAAATWEFLVFGGRDNGGSVGGFAQVKLDDVRIYNSVVTQAEIAAIADRNLTDAEKIADTLSGAGVATGFRYQKFTRDGGALSNIDDGVGLLTGQSYVPSGTGAAAGSVGTVNFGGGIIGGDAAFPGGSADNMVTQWAGVLDIQSAGQYVFGVNSDDGFRLTIGGKLVGEFFGPTGGSDERVGVTFDSAGLYRFELVHYNGGGGNHVEFWGKQGTDAAVGPLVGGAGGIVVYENVLTSGEKIGDAITAGTGAQGLTANYAQRSGFNVNSLYQATELLTGSVAPTATLEGARTNISGVGVPHSFAGDHFGGEFLGVMNITAPGLYNFMTSSDDGFRLEIGGTVVSEANYPKGTGTTITNSANFLEAGIYQFRLTWFEKTGLEGMTFVAQDGAANNVELFAMSGGENTIEQLATGFSVRTAKLAGGQLGGTLDNVFEARQLLANPSLYASALVHGRTEVINYLDGGGDANYGGGQTPDLTGDHYAIQALASVFITDAGFWTFGVNADDGFALALGGNVVLERFGTGGPADFLATVFFENAGWHDLELIYFESGVGAEVELFAAMGAHTAWNSGDFRLVGDTANGGLLVMSVPAPAALPAGLALIALVAARRSRR